MTTKIIQEDFKNYFEKKAIQLNGADESLFRRENFRLFNKKDLENILLLIEFNYIQILTLFVKQEWEKYMFEKLDKIEAITTCESLKINFQTATNIFFNDFAKYMQKTGIQAILKHLTNSELNKYFEEVKDIEIELKHILISKVFYHSILSDEVLFLSEKNISEKLMLRNSSDHEANDFIDKKCIWVEKTEQAEYLHLELEQIRIKNGKIEQEWMSKLGEKYINLIESIHELKLLQHKIEIKKQNPELTESEITEQAQSLLLEEIQKIHEAKEMLFSQQTKLFSDEQTIEDIEQYNNECKKLLREIYLKTHPDRLIGKNLTQAQVIALAAIYQMALDLRSSEKGFDLRSLDSLMNLLQQIDNILEQEGLFMQDRSVINGRNLNEQIKWLNTEIARLDIEINDLRNMISALATNKDIRTKMLDLSSEENIAYKNNQMKNEYIELSKEIENMRSKYATMNKG